MHRFAFSMGACGTMVFGTKETPSFLEAAAGLLLEPGQTIEELLKEEPPPYVLTFSLALILSIFVPLISQLTKFGITLLDSRVLGSVAIVFIFTFGLFILLEGVFLQLLGINFTVRKLFSILVYSVTPLTLALWLIYGFNYLAAGRLTIVSLLVTGYGSVDDRFLSILPVAVGVVQLMTLVFYSGLRVMGALGGFTAFMIAVFSLVPFHLSLLTALFLGDVFRPGTINIFMRLLSAPASLSGMGG